MISLRKCNFCSIYTLKEKCDKCGKESKNAAYKFKGLRDEKETH